MAELPNLFISYCHADREHLAELERHLKPLKRENLLKYWVDTNLKGGDHWSDEIENAIEAANVAILLVSPHFLASDFIMTKELPALLEKKIKILWVCLSHCNFNVAKDLSSVQGVINPVEPLASRTTVERDRVWVDICRQVLASTQAPQEVTKASASAPERPAGLSIEVGDILKQGVDAIVIPASETMDGRFGLERHVHRAGGPRLQEECLRIGGCEIGGVRWTRGYDLKAKNVIHTVGPYWDGGRPGMEERLASCYRRALEMARYHGYKSLAFSTISTGEKGFPLSVASRIALQEIAAFLEEVPETRISVVCYDESMAQAYNATVTSMFRSAPPELKKRVEREPAEATT